MFMKSTNNKGAAMNTTFEQKWEQREALAIQRDQIASQNRHLAKLTPIQRLEWDAIQASVEADRESIEAKLIEKGVTPDVAFARSSKWADRRRDELVSQGWL